MIDETEYTDTELLDNGESFPGNKERFRDMHYLHARYASLRDNNQKRTSWETINKMYERYCYVHPDTKTKDVNFGQLRFKVDRAISSFEDVLTARQLWCKINTYEGENDKQNAEWSRIISDAFHKYAINTWIDKSENIRLSVFDMTMYGKGVEHWCEKTGYRSENIPISSVLPDSNATIDPDSFDLLFIRKKLTVGELYEIASDSTSEGYGWDTDALIDLIRYSGNQEEDVFRKMERGQASPDAMDKSIDIVYAYVKEYTDARKNISMYVFPENGTIVRSNDDQYLEKRYLMRALNYEDSFRKIISLRTNMTTRSFWNDTSFAEQLVASCRLYDQLMNKMIRAVIRNTILFLKTDDEEQRQRLASLTAEEVQILGGGDDIIQRSVSIDISSSFQMMRQVMFDTDSSLGSKLATGSQNVKGRAITAEEARIQAQNAQSEVSIDVKMFMICEFRYIEELYRRFIHMNQTDKGYKFLKNFKDTLKAHAIPDEAWSIDNVVVQPYHNPSGTSTEGISGAANAIIAALSRSPQSDGEHRATWDIIAALVGPERADYYLQERDYVDSDAWKAGMENEAMSNSDVFPKNVMVMPRDNHFIHMTFHLADAMHVVETVFQKFGMVDQNQATEEAKPIVLSDIANMLISLNLKMSHMEAHIAMYSRSIETDARAKNAIDGFRAQMQQIRLREKAAENKIAAEFQARITSTKDQAIMDIELKYKQAMHEEDLRYQKSLHDTKLGNQVEKAQVMDQVAQQKTTRKMQSQAISDQSKAQSAKDKLDSQRNMAALQLAEQQQKLENTANDQTRNKK